MVTFGLGAVGWSGVEPPQAIPPPSPLSTPVATSFARVAAPDPARPAGAESAESAQVAAADTSQVVVPDGARAAAPTSERDPAQVAAPDSLDGERYGRLDGERAVVYFAARDSLVAERVLALLEGQPPLPGLPDSLPARVTAILAHTPEAFDEATGAVVPEWRAGVAIPSRNTLVMPTGEGVRVLDAEGRRTLRHEWAHLGLHAYLGDLRAPRWFDEGYAQWASGGFDAMEAWRLRVLIAAGRSPAMDSLELRWPRGREQARTAYLLAASAVTYLLQGSGERGLAIFLDRWRAERSFDTALRATFGVTPGQLEEDWKRHVRSRYGWLFVLSHSAVFWSLLALLLLFMVRTRRTHNREKMARMRASEPPDSPAYWMGENGGDGPAPPPSGV